MMMPFPHTVSVYRRPKTPSSLGLEQAAAVQQHASLRCRIEPARGRNSEVLFGGSLDEEQHLLQCGIRDAAGATVSLEAGDIVVAVSGPGLTAGREWLVMRVLQDTLRPAIGIPPYQVAFLHTPLVRQIPE